LELGAAAADEDEGKEAGAGEGEGGGLGDRTDGDVVEERAAAGVEDLVEGDDVEASAGGVDIGGGLGDVAPGARGHEVVGGGVVGAAIATLAGLDEAEVMAEFVGHGVDAAEAGGVGVAHDGIHIHDEAPVAEPAFAVGEGGLDGVADAVVEEHIDGGGAGATAAVFGLEGGEAVEGIVVDDHEVIGVKDLAGEVKVDADAGLGPDGGGGIGVIEVGGGAQLSAIATEVIADLVDLDGEFLGNGGRGGGPRGESDPGKSAESSELQGARKFIKEKHRHLLERTTFQHATG